MLDNKDQVEIDELAKRCQLMSRRDAIKVGRTLAFVVPAIAAFVVPRQALGQTGSGFIDDGGGNGMGNMGMGNMGMGNMGMGNMGMGNLQGFFQ